MRMRCRAITGLIAVVLLHGVAFQAVARGRAEEAVDETAIETPAAEETTLSPEQLAEAVAALPAEREAFRIGIAELTPVRVPVEFGYIASTIPRLLVERLTGLDQRQLSDAELASYAGIRVETALRSARENLTREIDRRSTLLFGANTTEEQYAESDERIARARAAVDRLESLRLADAYGVEVRAIRFPDSHASGRLLASLAESPTDSTAELRRRAEEEDLDLLVFGTVEEMRQRNEVLDEACAAIGRDPAEVWRGLYGWAALMPSDPWQSPNAFADMVGRYREAGVNEFIIDQPAAEQLPMAERIAAELLPKLRASATG